MLFWINLKVIPITIIYIHTAILDQKELTDAQKYLEQAAKANLADFLVGLCQVLADTRQSQVARIAAGLQVRK